MKRKLINPFSVEQRLTREPQLVGAHVTVDSVTGKKAVKILWSDGSFTLNRSDDAVEKLERLDRNRLKGRVLR